jgi:hypothetical protein
MPKSTFTFDDCSCEVSREKGRPLVACILKLDSLTLSIETNEAYRALSSIYSKFGDIETRKSLEQAVCLF